MHSAKLRVWLATENKHKLSEAHALLSGQGIDVRQLRLPKVEIQSSDLGRIAIHAAREIARETDRPIIVEDSGLFIKALKGFPGPYSSFVRKTIGLNGILQLMDDMPSRKAYFQSTVAASLPKRTPRIFSSRVHGSISHRPLGTNGFGFDPIFVPGRERRTFGQMSLQEKNKRSHRARALQRFASWFLLQDRNSRNPNGALK